MSSISNFTKAVFWLGIPILLATLYYASPLAAALSLPVLCVPSILLRRSAKNDDISLEHLDALVWAFLAAGIIGLAAVSVLQGILCYIFAFVLFGDETQEYYLEFARSSTHGLSDEHLQRRALMASNWHYLVFCLAFTFIAAGGVEELMKYIVIRLTCRSRTSIREHEYIQLAVAASLGFSVFENIGYIYTACNEDVLILSMTGTERIIIAMPAHSLSGYLIAIEIIHRNILGEKRDLGQILALPIFYHGLFDFVLFAASAANGNVGWVHPKDPRSITITLLLALGVLTAIFLHVRMKLNRLETSPRRKAIEKLRSGETRDLCATPKDFPSYDMIVKTLTI